METIKRKKIKRKWFSDMKELNEWVDHNITYIPYVINIHETLRGYILFYWKEIE